MLAHNIYKLSVIKFAKWFMLYMPIIGLFYADNNLSAFQLFIIQAGYSFSSAVFEIPSGYFADVVGRRKTLIIGSSMGALGFIIYSMSGSFVAFLCAEIIMELVKVLYPEPILLCFTIRCNIQRKRCVFEIRR